MISTRCVFFWWFWRFLIQDGGLQDEGRFLVFLLVFYVKKSTRRGRLVFCCFRSRYETTITVRAPINHPFFKPPNRGKRDTFRKKVQRETFPVFSAQLFLELQKRSHGKRCRFRKAFHALGVYDHGLGQIDAAVQAGV